MSLVISGFINIILLLSFSVVLGFASFTIFNVIYNKQSLPFIDEIFHIPQAQLYCRNEWTKWDPKITTLPGLYIVSYFFLKPLEYLGYEHVCSVYSLRFTNVIATVFNFLLAYSIIGLLEEKYKVKSKVLLRLLSAFNIAIFPPLYFFTFLYYTDIWSTTSVFLMYNLHLRGGRFFQILGYFVNLMAVMMRQTNIIWVGLMILDDAWNILCNNCNTASVQDYNYSKWWELIGLEQIAFISIATTDDEILALRHLYSISVFQKVFQKFCADNFGLRNIRNLCKLIYKILTKTFYNVVICLFFISFVAINKSIVLGDKTAHSATFHPMQNLYFLDFSAFFALPFVIFEVPSLLKKPPNMFLLIFLIGLSSGLSEMNKLEHPYLLADNRHYAFYLWKRIFGHDVIRRLVIPTYALSAVLLWRVLQKRCHFMFMVSLSVCTILNLTPQYLFELRYFIIPFLLCRLQFKQTSAVFLETVLFVIVNYGVVYVFLNRSFVWISERDVVQRFIW